VRFEKDLESSSHSNPMIDYSNWTNHFIQVDLHDLHYYLEC